MHGFIIRIYHDARFYYKNISRCTVLWMSKDKRRFNKIPQCTKTVFFLLSLCYRVLISAQCLSVAYIYTTPCIAGCDNSRVIDSCFSTGLCRCSTCCSVTHTHRQVSTQLYQHKYGYGSQIWAVLSRLGRFAAVINVTWCNIELKVSLFHAINAYGGGCSGMAPLI